jgi:hypothetical protein
MVKWAGALVPVFYPIYIAVATFITAELVRDDDPAGVRQLEWAIPVVVFFGLPSFTYYSIKLSDTWFFSWKRFVALWYRSTKDGKELLEKRAELQKRVREFVSRTVREPTFAGVYKDKNNMSKTGKKIHPAPMEMMEEGAEAAGGSESFANKAAAGVADSS